MSTLFYQWFKLGSYMLKFTIRKLLAVLFLFSFTAIFANDDSIVNDFLARIKTKTNNSFSLDAVSKSTNNSLVTEVIAKFNDAHAELKVLNKNGNFSIQSSSGYSDTYLNQIVADCNNALKNLASSEINNTFDLSTKINIFVSNKLCDIIGIKDAAVLPSSFLNNNTSTPTILLAEDYTSSSLQDVLVFLAGSANKNGKKFATDDVEDLRLRINILYYDKDLVQIDELALNPTTVTTASSTRFRAKGGTFEYLWRLVPSEDSDAKISSTTDSDITYTAGSNESRDFDILILTDGIEEVSINIVVAKVRLENDGSGSKGGNCFIRPKFRD